MNSLPREATYDPLLQQLLFFPIAEMSALRTPATPIAVVPTGTVVNGELPLKLPAGSPLDDAALRRQVYL